MLRVLVTGFRPFGKAEINPTEWLMQALAGSGEVVPGVGIETLVLDTDYVLCEEQFRAAWERFDPAAVLSFGLNMASDEIRLERIAVNIDDARIADTGGHLRNGQRIVPDGPVGYWSTLPLAEMHGLLKEAGIPVALSNHAGTYVCNHLFYYGRHLAETRRQQTPTGFIHVPPFPEQVAGETGRSGMAPAVLRRAAVLCVEATACYLRLEVGG
mgnify:CR=1 FL=1